VWSAVVVLAPIDSRQHQVDPRRCHRVQSSMIANSLTEVTMKLGNLPGSVVEQCLAADNWMRTVVGTWHDALLL
jgi:hypothetical protein